MARYKINGLQDFKRGGMAKLQIGHLKNGCEVVLRQLQQQYRFNFRIRKKFKTGIKVRNKIRRHPNIVWTYEIGSRGFLPYEIIDYVNGPSLQELLHKNASYVRLHAQELLLQIAEAIFHVHQCGYLHLDVKAGNILIDMRETHPTARLTDFDLAMPISKRRRASRENRMGTFNYMPPEQLSQGEISEKSDVFAFGVLAYNMFTTEMPFKAETALESRHKKLDDSIVIKPLKQICPDVSVKLSDLIDSCLERDPAKRCPNMRIVVKNLCTITAMKAIAMIEKTQVVPAVDGGQ